MLSPSLPQFLPPRTQKERRVCVCVSEDARAQSPQGRLSFPPQTAAWVSPGPTPRGMDRVCPAEPAGTALFWEPEHGAPSGREVPTLLPPQCKTVPEPAGQRRGDSATTFAPCHPLFPLPSPVGLQGLEESTSLPWSSFSHLARSWDPPTWNGCGPSALCWCLAAVHQLSAWTAALLGSRSSSKDFGFHPFGAPCPCVYPTLCLTSLPNPTP